MKSMTGFAAIQRETESFALSFEIKAVNHRYRDLLVKLPSRFSALEDPIRRAIGVRAKRGRIEAALKLRETGKKPASSLNREVAASYLKALEELREMMREMRGGALAGFDPAAFLALPDAIAPDEAGFDADSAWEELKGPICEAADAFDAARKREGEAIHADLRKKLSRVRELARQLASEARELPRLYLEGLKNRISQLGPAPVDEERLIGEMLIYADKCSVDEELTRIRLHCDNLEKEMGSLEPVGRKLDFLLQELNREANTIASKSSSFSVSVATAEIKNELEKMREQVQNIE
jgi:uncharacterized protein (TIGR00255 family)